MIDLNKRYLGILSIDFYSIKIGKQFTDSKVKLMNIYLCSLQYYLHLYIVCTLSSFKLLSFRQ